LSSAMLVGLARPRPRLALRPMRPASALPPLSSSGRAVIPASSRIRSSLNLSLKLFLVGRLCASPTSPSCPSSNLLSIISGLLLIVAIDETVFLRSPLVFGEVNVGDVMVSLGVEVFLESQENGLVSFLVGAGAGDVRWELACGCGGGAHGIEGSTPERPCREDFAFLGGGIGLEFSEDYCISSNQCTIDIGLYLSTNLVSRGSRLPPS